MKTLGTRALILLALGLATSALATDVEMKIDVAGTERTIVITLDEEIAPKTSANFVKLCSEGYYDGIGFHRIIANYIVQGGDPLTKDPASKAKWGTGGPGYTVPAELGGKHLRGAVAAARLGDKANPDKESNGSQFYVVLRDVAPLDGEYTVFGKVTSGLEVFDEISGAPTDDSQVPQVSIKIVSTAVKSADTPPEPPASTSLTSAPPMISDSTVAIATPAPQPESIPIPAPEPVPAPAPAPPAPTPAPLNTEPDPLASASSPAPPAPAPTPEPAPAPAPAPASALESDPLATESVGSRFQLEGLESMPVNVDRGMPAMPRLDTDSDRLIEAAKDLTGREDGFVPMTTVGTDGSSAAPPPAPAPAAPASPPPPAPTPAPPVSDPAPLPPSSPPAPPSTEVAAMPPTSEPFPEEPASAFDDGFTAPTETGIPTTNKKGEPIGPLGRFFRRIW